MTEEKERGEWFFGTFGKDVDPADTAARMVRFSGAWWDVPNYAEAYAAAARTLLATAVATDQLPVLGLPIFFLQRHAVELAVKDVIATLVEQREEERVIAMSDAEWEAYTSTFPRDLEAIAEADGHDLGKLIGNASSLLTERGYKTLLLPSEFAELAAMVDAFEQGHVERARFDRVREKKTKATKKKQESKSLPHGKPLSLRLGDIQDRIDALFAGPMRVTSSDDDTFMAAIAEESHANLQHLGHLNRL